MRKVSIVVAVTVMALGLSACAAEINVDGKNPAINSFSVSFPDATKVDCLLLDLTKGSGVRCDWDNRSSLTKTHSGLKGSIENLSNKDVRCVSYDGNSEGALDCDI